MAPSPGTQLLNLKPQAGLHLTTPLPAHLLRGERARGCNVNPLPMVPAVMVLMEQNLGKHGVQRAAGWVPAGGLEAPRPAPRLPTSSFHLAVPL